MANEHSFCQSPYEGVDVYTIDAAAVERRALALLQVRKLMPIEGERLMGLPPDYTNIPGAKDADRYKAIGNSMAVPVTRWIGERIQAVDTL